MQPRTWKRLTVAVLTVAVIKTALFLILVVLCFRDVRGPAMTTAGVARVRLMLYMSAAAGVGALICTVAAFVLILKARLLGVRALQTDLQEFEESGFQRRVTTAAVERSLAAEDISRLRMSFAEMTERIIGKIQHLSDAEDHLRALVTEISHDLRTPLALLQGYLETLATRGASLPADEQRNYISIAMHHAERLQRLIAELFELAELDMPNVAVNRTPTSIRELGEDVCAAFQLRARDADVRVRCTLDDDLPLVDVDPRLMERVFENLLDNAIRHSTKRGGEVILHLAHAPNGVDVIVSDRGSGIDERDLPFIFERFYRSRSGDERAGSGIGLAIVRRILQLHGSEISVQSTAGVGTTFRFLLPAVPR